MTGPAVPDVLALRRRVLLTGLLSLAVFLAVAYVIATAGASDLWLLVAAGLIYALVIRPLMRPVREVTRMRRDLAYQAFREGRDDDRRDSGS
ncbi:MAG: hypothetical protein JWN35_307 [Frankiales bacterium]|jgi:chromate transport protein ChrA|nr:hypothetical protein [Frankiales bacterium]